MDKEATEKTTLRNKSIGTKVSEDEYAALEKLAEARGRVAHTFALFANVWGNDECSLLTDIPARIIIPCGDADASQTILRRETSALHYLQLLSSPSQAGGPHIRALCECVG